MDLFLSANADDVQDAINSGHAAGRIYEYSSNSTYRENEKDIIKVAFDGDAVIFSEESEKIYQEKGLEAFLDHEKQNANEPLPDGPFAKLLKTLSFIQGTYPSNESPIRTALVPRKMKKK